MPDIEASLSFLADIPLYGHEKPFRVVLSADEPDVEESLKSNVEMEIHDKIELRNIRGMDMLPSLDIQGFEFIRHKTKYKRLDEVWQCKGYTKEITAVLENHLGAERVITWDLRVPSSAFHGQRLLSFFRNAMPLHTRREKSMTQMTPASQMVRP